MKKKKGLKLFAGLLLLVLLIGGYIAATFYFKEDTEEDTEKEEEFTVNTVTQDDIQKIAFTNEKTSMTFYKKDDTWYFEKDKEFHVNQYKIDAMTQALAEVKSSKEIKKSEVDEKEFGLDKPTQEITFTMKDGKETTYTLGTLNSVVSKYYFKMSGKDSVYMIDTTMYNSFDYELLDIFDMEEYPTVANQDIYEFTLTKGAKTVYFKDHADAAHKKNASEIPDCKWYTGTKENQLKKADTDKANKIVQSVIGLTNSSCVSYHVTDKEKKKYGLDNPSLILEVNYTEMKNASSDTANTAEPTATPAEAKIVDKNYKVYFGNVSDAGEYYVYMEGADAIYTMNVSSVDTLLTAFEK